MHLRAKPTQGLKKFTKFSVREIFDFGAGFSKKEKVLTDQGPYQFGAQGPNQG